MAEISDVGPNSMILCSRGAADDPRNFYCSTSATTHKDWLDIYRSKFKLHISNSPSKINSVNLSQSKEVKSEIQKLGSGFTKNSLPYVKYDKTVDETDYKYETERFKTSTGLVYSYPVKPDNDSFAKTQFISQEITESGFTRVPKYRVTEHGHRLGGLQSEMKSNFVKSPLYDLDTKTVDKSKIVPSSSAFTSDIGHIKGFGVDTTSPFKKPAQVPLRPAPNEDALKVIPSRMDLDGFTRSELNAARATLRDQSLWNQPSKRWNKYESEEKRDKNGYIQNKTVPVTDIISGAATNLYNVGHKEEGGSVRNNRSYWSHKDEAVTTRYKSETNERYSTPHDKFNVSQFTCDSMTSSGFTSSNKYGYTFDVPSEESLLNSLHPTYAAHKRHVNKHVMMAKPSNHFANMRRL